MDNQMQSEIDDCKRLCCRARQSLSKGLGPISRPLHYLVLRLYAERDFNKAIGELLDAASPQHIRVIEIAYEVAKGLPWDLRAPFVDLIKDKYISGLSINSAIMWALGDVLRLRDEQHS